MNILMITLDAERMGLARLVQPLHETGFRVSALCPHGTTVSFSSFLEHHFPLSSETSSQVIERELAAAMRATTPDLIVPGDERAVACLQDILRRADAGKKVALDAAALALLRRVLGRPEQFNAMLMKSDTQALARKLGVATPLSVTVTTAEAALREAEQIGYPVVLKQSFSWAGQGVSFCANETALRSNAAPVFAKHGSPLRTLAKRALHRDWYPTTSAVDVQKAVDGKPAFWCGVVIEGRVLCGFAGLVQQASSATGPSSVIRIAPHAQMHEASVKMAAALGLTGFVSFDFMVESETGRALLLECNPRPVPACHLGAHIGVDLCAALAAGLRGEAVAVAEAEGEELVALFPQEWQRDPQALAIFTGYVDMPAQDQGLLRHIADKFPDAAALLPLEPAAPEAPVAVKHRRLFSAKRNFGLPARLSA